MIITIAAQKGGVGKTTTAAAIAQALGLKKKNKVLLIDCDGQASASNLYGIHAENGAGLYEVIKGSAAASEAIRETEAGAIIPGGAGLYGLDVELQNKPGRDLFLKKALEEISGQYTHIIIDTAPGLGTCLIQALTASQGVIIPVLCDAQSLNGVRKITNTIKEVQEFCNNDLQLLGVLITRYQPRTILARQYEDLIKEEAAANGTKLLNTKIRQGVAIQEAQALRKNLYNYAPKSKPAEDYLKLIKELKI